MKAFAWPSKSEPGQLLLSFAVGAILIAYALVFMLQGFNYILTWDVFGYYLYLPATFIYSDPFFQDQTWVDSVIASYENTGSLYQLVELSEGRREVKYSIGIALLNLPFFALGHLHAVLSGAATDGFSGPYNLWINIGYLFYALVGLFAIKSVLQRLFSPAVSGIVLLLLYFGSNLLDQIIGAGGMPHVYAFCLYALLFLCLCEWGEKPSRKLSLLTGLVLGTLAIVRPPEAIAIIIVVLWNYDGGSFKAFVHHKIIHWFASVWAPVAVGMASIVALQFVRWKMATGSFLFFGYQNPGEGFDFMSPYTWDFLFSFRKGWLLYSPLMVFALIGLFFLNKSKLRWSIGLHVILSIYIVSSWSCWWYADSFGNRGIVQTYAVLALPMAAFVRWSANQSWVLRGASYLLLFLTAGLNLFQTWQFNEGMIHSGRMTQEAYSAVFLSCSMPEDIDALFSIDREAAMRHPIDTSVFSEQTLKHVPGEDSLSAAKPYAPVIQEPYKDLTGQDHVWIEVEATLIRANSESNWPALAFSVERAEGEYAVSYQWPAAELAASGKDTIRFRGAYLTPHIRSIDDRVKAYFWLNGSGAVIVRNQTISIRQKP